MPMPERNWTRRGLAIAAAILLALLVIALIAAPLLDRGEPAPSPTNDAGPRPIEIEAPPLPVPAPPLSRADLIRLAARAASAHATGEALSADDVALIGRNFIVSIPFGCEGPAATEPKTGVYWTQEAGRGAITLVAHPQIWTETPWVRALAGERELEAVEGFWLARPWILSEDCPATAAPVDAAAPPVGEQTLGLAMLFEPGSSRVAQRGSRPYEFVGKAPGGDAPVAPKGFRLALSGRVVGFSTTEPVRCRTLTEGRRPVCLIAVAFDQVAFEDPATGKTLAEWRMN